ncbi:hypothetical protein GMORB2_4834 [Geosmithia morbida]|uniref:Uncharacterized protein n=1 Tax=Geosmithia morbida TaxID=1094350 RepID=A0A9P5D0X8_9HYPO|nr:uncharacterized protein GMORB2_4834 [Geosmithia morbida]KAF4119315.1 hypothetical protein GMORB2_4834 [Geosmithia morbida]
MVSGSSGDTWTGSLTVVGDETYPVQASAAIGVGVGCMASGLPGALGGFIWCLRRRKHRNLVGTPALLPQAGDDDVDKPELDASAESVPVHSPCRSEASGLDASEVGDTHKPHELASGEQRQELSSGEMPQELASDERLQKLPSPHSRPSGPDTFDLAGGGGERQEAAYLGWCPADEGSTMSLPSSTVGSFSSVERLGNVAKPRTGADSCSSGTARALLQSTMVVRLYPPSESMFP